MDPKVNKALAELNQKMFGNVVMFSYLISQLCTKADATCLLQLTVNDGGVEKNIEDVANIIVHTEEGDDDKIDLIPKDGPDQIGMISQAVSESYPEFDQSVEKSERDDEQVEQMRKMAEEATGYPLSPIEEQYFLRLTVPPVNDDRKDVILKALDALNEGVKAKMTAAFSFYSAQIAIYTVNSSPEEAEEVKNSLESLKKEKEEMRETLLANKQKEVEDANARYHLQKGKDEEGEEAGSEGAWQKLKME